MVNRKALNASSKAAAKKDEQRAYWKSVKYPILKQAGHYLTDENGKKEWITEPTFFTVISPPDFADDAGPIQFTVHDYLGDKRLDQPALCQYVHNPASRGCKYCDTPSIGDDGKKKAAYASTKRCYMVFNHTDYKRTYVDSKGEKGMCRYKQFALIGQGGLNAEAWESIDEAASEDKLNVRVFCQKRNVKTHRTRISPVTKRETKDDLNSRGRVSKDAREEVAEMSFDEMFAHALNLFVPSSVNWDHWGVEKPEAVVEESETKPVNAESDDDDDAPVVKKASSKVAKPSKKRSAEEEDDAEAEDEEEDKPRLPKKKAAKSVGKVKKEVIEDDDEEDPEEEEESDGDESDSEDDED